MTKITSSSTAACAPKSIVNDQSVRSRRFTLWTSSAILRPISGTLLADKVVTTDHRDRHTVCVNGHTMGPGVVELDSVELDSVDTGHDVDPIRRIPELHDRIRVVDIRDLQANDPNPKAVSAAITRSAMSPPTHTHASRSPLARGSP